MSGGRDGGRRLHVAVVTCHPARMGGMEKFSRFLVGSLLAAGWRVTVALSGEDIFDGLECGESPRRHGGTERRSVRSIMQEGSGEWRIENGERVFCAAGDVEPPMNATRLSSPKSDERGCQGNGIGFDGGVGREAFQRGQADDCPTHRSRTGSTDSGGLVVEGVEWLDGTCAGDRRYERGAIADRRRWFRRVGPDAVVFVQSSNTPLRAAVAGAALAGVPIVTTHRTMPWPVEDVPSRRHLWGLVPGLHLHRRRVAFKTRLTARLARAVVYNSHEVRRQYEEVYGYPRHKGVVIANAVEGPVDSSVAAGGGAGDGVITIGYVGRISREKRLDVLMRAVAGVRSWRPVRLVFYGEGPERAKLEALAAELGMAERVTWAGVARDVWSAYGSCDVVALCSPRESSSNMVLEAMAAGRAVVVSEAGGLPELVDGGRAGLCVPALDVAALAAAFERLIEDEDLRRRLGAHGRRLARERHDPARIARQWQELLLRVSGCGWRRSPAEGAAEAVAAAGGTWG